jgi:hypothetical protein
MAQAIRQVGLKLMAALLRMLTRRTRAGWQTSRRPATLRGR